MIPNRGSFPKVNHPETPEEKRARFEAWMIETAQGGIPDPELGAILSQPHHDPTGETKNNSLTMLVRARCWQCVAGNEDDGAMDRIRGCASTACQLWPIRPYKTQREEEAEKGKQLTRRPAINRYCRECQGGDRMTHIAQAVSSCPSVTCALWPGRPVLVVIGLSGTASVLQPV